GSKSITEIRSASLKIIPLWVNLELAAFLRLYEQTGLGAFIAQVEAASKGSGYTGAGNGNHIGIGGGGSMNFSQKSSRIRSQGGQENGTDALARYLRAFGRRSMGHGASSILSATATSSGGKGLGSSSPREARASSSS
ncbi:unnamed protein product, partial [Amoebophrya sp. A25]